MDFKAKFSKNRSTQGFPNRLPQTGNRPATDNPLSNAFNSSKMDSLSKPIKNQASSLNKYKKAPSKGEAPVGQFKHYLLEAKNVFYEDRAELKQLQNLKSVKLYLLLIWVILSATYFVISRITPYQGVCPSKATCGVYVHCPQLFEYDQDENKCIVSRDFMNQVEESARQKVLELQYLFGENQCSGIQTVPTLNIKDLFNDLEDSRKIEITRNAAITYFKNIENQKNEGFQLVGVHSVIPTKKKFSISCSISIFITSNLSFSSICYILGLGSLFVLIAVKIQHSRKYSVMYKYLKNRVFDEPNKVLNITHTMAQLQSLFGPIDEEAWGKINDQRTSDKTISFYEDDFLYWKAA